ncbi:AraC family transcriptional regulator [Paenibacillus flagellatus]|uniref:AraC family transcriptional regulator n=2 Tax=Paenibacillus flagellatus TaxID=2211139 RepID=A0A2V5L1P2_9BACL|nr:AraC family transcriptional regulator [Paenibacillus flagellatus]
MPIRIGYKYSLPVHSSYATYHSHPQCEIYYFHGGSCTFVIGDRLYVMTPGDLIIMDGMTLHFPKIDPAVAYTRTTIHFDRSYVEGLLTLPAPIDLLGPFDRLRNHVINLNEAERDEVEAMLQRLHELGAVKAPVSYNRFCLHFADLLLFIYERCERSLAEPRKPLSEKEKNVQKIISYIEAHYEQDIHLDGLESELHLDKHYLSRIFKEVTGVTIFTHLYTRRINQAQLLFMIEPNETVTNVCYRVGFKHLPHFSRIFKKYVGLTPESFRKTRPKVGKES